MKNLFLFVLLGLSSLSVSSQDFVNASNLWYIDECCADIMGGGVDCFTYEYKFGDPVQINGLTYFKLEANNSEINLAAGSFYREDEGKVYMKYNMNFDEVLIYDFNLELGEQVTIGNSGFTYDLEVIGIDSVELISGEKRKRLELTVVNSPNRTAFWIEGIGSLVAPMDTRFMFSFDCWVELDCYFFDAITQYSLKDCLLSSSIKENRFTRNNIEVFPNPVEFTLNLKNNSGQNINSLSVHDAKGANIRNYVEYDSNQVDVTDLANGLYFLLVTFSDGKKEIKRFVKN